MNLIVKEETFKKIVKKSNEKNVQLAVGKIAKDNLVNARVPFVYSKK